VVRKETSDVKSLLRLFGLAAASFGGAQVSAGPPLASYVSISVNGGTLPSTDVVTDPHGTRFLVEFDELVLSLRARNEFRASLRYRQSLAEKGVAMRREPIQSMTVYGRYEVNGNGLRFIPDPKRGGKGIEILDGTFAGGRIDVPFWYRNGQVSRKAQVVLRRDPSRF
jgi:hypothetical protein